MDFLPVTHSLQVLELTYKLHPKLTNHRVSFAECPDISLGLVETRAFSAVLTAQPTLLHLKDTIVTLRRINVTFSKDVALVKLEPLQEMQLHFEAQDAVVDAIPRLFHETKPYSKLLQHLILARLEHVLGSLAATRLKVELKTKSPKMATEVLRLRAYGYSQRGYSKKTNSNHA